MITLRKWTQPISIPIIMCCSSNSSVDKRFFSSKHKPHGSKHSAAGKTAHSHKVPHKVPGRGPTREHVHHGEGGVGLHSSYPGAACWACEAIFVPENDRFCNSCHKLQPLIPHNNYFELFKCDVAFEVDEKHLEKQFQILQKLLHPDRFFTHEEPEQEFSQNHSAEINEAYQTLRRPLNRAKYLMTMKGIDLEEAVSRSGDDMEMLMEMMELREWLDDSPSHADVQARLAPYSDELRHLYKQFSEAYQQNDMEASTSILTRAMYIQKVLDDA